MAYGHSALQSITHAKAPSRNFLVTTFFFFLRLHFSYNRRSDAAILSCFFRRASLMADISPSLWSSFAVKLQTNELIEQWESFKAEAYKCQQCPLPFKCRRIVLAVYLSLKHHYPYCVSSSICMLLLCSAWTFRVQNGKRMTNKIM